MAGRRGGSAARLVLAILVAGCSSMSPTHPPVTGQATPPAAASQPTVAPSVPAQASSDLPDLADIPFYRGDVDGQLLGPGPGPTGRPALAWQQKFGASLVWPLLVDGLLIAGRADGGVVGLDGRTGGVRWRFAPDDGVVQSIAAADGLVFLDGSQTVYAVDLHTGAQRWAVPVDTPFRGVIVNGVVYVATMGGAVGLSETDGTTVWRWAGPKGRKSTVVRVADGVAFITAGDGHIYAIDVATGAQRWPPFQSISLNAGGVAVVGDTLYVGAVQGDAVEPVGQLSAIDRMTGAVRWQYPSPSGFQISAGAVRDGVLYGGGARDGVFALRDDGDHPTLLWQVPAPASYFAPVLVGDTLYVQRADGSIGAYDAGGGKLLWETDSLDSAARGPLVSGGMIFTVNDDNGVMAFADPSLIAQLPRASPEPTAEPAASFPSAPDPFTIVKAMPLAAAGIAIPLSLSVGPDGLVYVLDTKPSVTVIDPTDWHVVRSWGRQGSGPGEFDLTRIDDNPGNGDIELGRSGRIFVADGSNHRVQVFEPGATLPTAVYGRYGDGPGQFGAVVELALDPQEDMYILDGSLNAITKLAPDGTQVWRDDASITGGASPVYLHGVVVRPDGDLLVSCEGCGGLIVIDPDDGHVVDTFHAAFVDDVTGWFDRGGAFDSAGNFFGDTWLLPGHGADVAIAPNGDVIGIRYGTLSEIGQTVHSWGTSFYPNVAIAPDGYLYSFNDQGLVQVKVTLPGS